MGRRMLIDRARAIREGKAAVLRRVEAAAKLSDEDRAAVAYLLGVPTDHPHGHELISPGTTSVQPFFVLAGWVCRAVGLPDGRRQIVDFYIPGDLAAHFSRSVVTVSASYVCLTSAIVASASDVIARAREQASQHPGLFTAFAAIEDEVEHHVIEQAVRLGSMPAHERTLHFMRNLHRRHQRAGIGSAEGFVMPLTQETLGDALGLSTIHVNRVLQQLRRDHIIRTSMGRVEILDTAMGRLMMQTEH